VAPGHLVWGSWANPAVIGSLLDPRSSTGVVRDIIVVDCIMALMESGDLELGERREV